MLGHHRRVVMFSCHLIPIVVIVHSGELVPGGCWCSFLSSLAASTHDPPCEQWLTGLGVGAGSSVVVVGSWGRFLVVVGPVRATPKSNSVDNVRALQGDATVLE